MCKYYTNVIYYVIRMLNIYIYIHIYICIYYVYSAVFPTTQPKVPELNEFPVFCLQPHKRYFNRKFLFLFLLLKLKEQQFQNGISVICPVLP